MTGMDDLPRLSSGDADCSDELRDLFRSARHDGPEPARVDELWRALQPIVGGPVGGPEGAPPPPEDGPAGGPATPVAVGAGQAVAGHSAASLARYALAGAGVSALIIASATVWSHLSESTMQPASTPVMTIVHAAAASSSSVPSAVALPEPITLDARAQKASPRREVPRALVAPDAAPMESEAQFLKHAHGALREGNAARALAMTAEHQRIYPHALLSQERELIAVEALVALGRRDEALHRSRAFLDRYPESAHARRLRTILGIIPGTSDEKKDPDNVIIADGGAHSPVERLETGDAGR